MLLRLVLLLSYERGVVCVCVDVNLTLHHIGVSSNYRDYDPLVC